MKKLLSLLLVLCMCLSSVILLASCGKSAYDIAVEGGFVGTEEEWLASLKGAAGTDGKDGKDGQNGDDGALGLPGLAGKDAAEAPKGTDGKDGISYEGKVSVNADGFWILDGVETIFKIDGTKCNVKDIQLVQDTFTVVDDAAKAPTLKIRYTQVGDAGEETVKELDVVDSMIVAGSVDYTTEGVYPITILYSGLSVEFNIKVEGLMVYYENFDALTGKTLQEIITATGFKIPVPGPMNVDSNDNTKHYHDGVGTWYTPEGQDLSANVVYGMFHRPNYVDLAVENGKLKYISAVGRAAKAATDTAEAVEADYYYDKITYTGMTDTALILVDSAYMAEAAKGDYTIQFNIIIPDGVSNVNSNIILGMRYLCEGKPDKTSNAHGRPQVIGVSFGAEVINHVHTRYGGTHKYPTNTSVLTTLFGDTELTTWRGENEITVRIVTRNKTSENAGYDVYIKKADATEFIKIHTYVVGEKNEAGADVNTQADTLYNSDTDAFVIHTRSIKSSQYFYIDDLAIWTGTSEMPTDKTTTAYEALLTPAA